VEKWGYVIDMIEDVRARPPNSAPQLIALYSNSTLIASNKHSPSKSPL